MSEMVKKDGVTQWQCECGEEHVAGVYVMAHWDEELIHTCDCGRKHSTLRGYVTLLKEKKTRKGSTRS